MSWANVEDGSKGNIPTPNFPQKYQDPTKTSASMNEAIQEPSAPFVAVQDQALQIPAPSVSFVVPQSISGYPYTSQTPSGINYGSYELDEQPPTYSELFGKGNSAYNPGPQAYPPQPWNQQIQPHYQSNIVVTAQPQPTPCNVMIVTSPSQKTPQAFATTSLVMAILGIFCCCFTSICCAIPGIVYAALSLRNTADPDKARSQANISMICTIAGWISGFIIVVVYTVSVISLTPY